MKSVVTGVIFIVFGLLILFHGYYSGDAEADLGEKKKGPDAVDLMMGFFMLGLGGYFIF